jgi:hypothetical protein
MKALNDGEVFIFSKIKVLAELVSLKHSILGLLVVLFSWCPPMAFSLGTHTPGVSPSSYKDTNQIVLRLILMTSFKLNYLLICSLSKYSISRLGSNA